MKLILISFLSVLFLKTFTGGCNSKVTKLDEETWNEIVQEYEGFKSIAKSIFEILNSNKFYDEIKVKSPDSLVRKNLHLISNLDKLSLIDKDAKSLAEFILYNHSRKLITKPDMSKISDLVESMINYQRLKHGQSLI